MTFGNGVALRNFSRRFGAALAALCALLIFAFAGAALAAETEPAPPRVAVYDLEPYGGQSRDGLFNVASVELWRRVAEDRNWRYQLTLVPRGWTTCCRACRPAPTTSRSAPSPSR